MIKRTNEEWLSDLTSESSAKGAALSDLRTIILAGLPFALSKWIDQKDHRFSSLVEESAQETLLRVMEKLDTFEGRSQFTTWVHTIAVRIALTEMRRAKWREISLDKILEGKEIDDNPIELPDKKVNVEKSVEINETMGMIMRIMKQELTEKQLMALRAVAIHQMPLEETARRLGTNRNALYKLLHDARLKIKNHLELQGMPPSEILGVFEQ
jgi:RNA polymerase sigma-70 factor, ECF subfamily